VILESVNNRWPIQVQPQHRPETMKRILLALTMVGLFLPLAPRGEADTEVSLNFFYDNLSPHGNWIDVAGYGYCFQPSVAVDNVDWRPYADGYWAYTDVGWTWVSYEDFGWATYHYGRWANLADYGWVWVPGYEWGPAWVSWRTGGDYIGWAPLPPVGDVIYEGRAITGQVDVLFDIGPLYYNFCDVRYIGEPVLRGRIFAPSRNVTIINQTINVTNITYNNSTVYNYGPDYNRLNQHSARPIQRLTLQRETTGDFGQGGKRGTFNRVNGNQLTVVAPAIQKSQQQVAPKQVKAKVEKPKVEHGWQGVQNRKQLQDEMKKENAKNVRPPSFQPQTGGKTQVAETGRNAQRDQGSSETRKFETLGKEVERPQKADAQQPVGRTNQENGREQSGLQARQQGTKPAQKEREAGMNDMSAEKQKSQQDARQAATKVEENSVKQPNKQAQRPPQNRQAQKAPPPPPHRVSPPQQQQQEQQQQEQQGKKKKKKPEDQPPGQ
jgi:Family of unknown function (DUF6600)